MIVGGDFGRLQRAITDRPYIFCRDISPLGYMAVALVVDFCYNVYKYCFGGEIWTVKS